jgi:predicted ATP-dependent endonuclease of OLD family
MTLVGLCMDENYEVLLIDEPELGLSPKLQSAIYNLFVDLASREKYFPHLKGIYVSTHSHIFLDKSTISNNYRVSKVGDAVGIEKVENMDQFHDLQFNMLGNSLDSLFLPSAVIIVEGKTDKPYIDRCVSYIAKGRTVAVIESQGDVKRVFRNFCISIGDIYKSPFHSRTFIVLDSIHSAGTKEELIRMGAKESNIIIWSNNGIEYLYPKSIMSKIFSCSLAEVKNINIVNDNIAMNGITKRKQELSELIVGQMTADTKLPDELTEKLLSPLSDALKVSQ